MVAADKHVNGILAITRQTPITKIELLQAVFSVGSVPRLYIARTPGRLKEFSCGIFARE
jgi:hypothetical protein